MRGRTCPLLFTSRVYNTFTYHPLTYLPWLLLGRLAFVPDGVSINGRFEAKRLQASAGPPSGGRAAFLTPMHPLYSTRPHGLLQAIFWHSCRMGYRSMADSRPKGSRLQLGHLRVGELLFWLLCTPCIALDLTVYFKLYSGIRAGDRFRSAIVPDSLDPHCT